MARMLTHLDRLEAESIHIMREVVAEADSPVVGIIVMTILPKSV